MLIPLHVKSDHSLGHGVASPARLAHAAAQRGLPALALTDLETLGGYPQFHAACTNEGVRAIAGVELRAGFAGRGRPGVRRGRLVLLARDGEGYVNLCRIVSTRRNGPERVAGDPVRDVVPHARGLFVMTDDPWTLSRLLGHGVAREQLKYLVVRPSAGADGEGLSFARAHLIEPVADLDLVMLDAQDHAVHELSVALALGRTLQEVRARRAAEPPERAWHDEPELLFGDVGDAVLATVRLADACRFDLAALRLSQRASSSMEERARAELSLRCQTHAEARTAYRQRVAHELDVLHELGFCSYFLSVSDVVNEAHRRGIQMVGRGSAASSLCAYLLGITWVDPIAEGLLFERFVHPGRRDLPDIDLDVPSHRRSELIAWATAHFAERAAMASSLQTFQRRSAYREGGKALGLTARELEHLIELAADDGPVDTHEPVQPGRVQAVRPLLERLIGMPRTRAAHPGGVVLAHGKLSDVVPLERNAEGVSITQCDATALDALGLLKLDLLGNHCLAELDEALAWRGGGNLATMPLDDARTFALVQRADTVGCFQLETPAMRSLLARLPCTSVGDIATALALVRPGPASGEAKATFLRRARGDEPTPRLPPPLAALLERTYGLMLYEEDITKVIHATTSLSLGEADVWRSELVRGTLSEQRFLERACAQGLSRETALSVWRDLSRFAAYSFSKAHAASHARLAYASAYMKAHAPREFGCALLNHHGGMYPLRTIAAELARMGVAIAPPSVQHSSRECTCEQGTLRIGLSRVKYLSERARADIIAARQASAFASVTDLARRVPLQRRELEALVMSGACDELSPLSRADFPFVHRAFLEAQAWDPRVTFDPARSRVRAARAEDEPRLTLYRALVRVQQELRHLDMHVSEHPMRLLRDEATRAGCVTSSQARASVDQRVRFAGLASAAHRLRLEDGRVMQFVTFEDELGLLEAVLSPALFATLGSAVATPGPYLVSGHLVEQAGDVRLAVSTLAPFHERPSPHGH
jgi:DNA-directed DNA polymerase III PolC